MDPLTMLQTQFMLFVFLGIGYILGKRGIITQKGRAEITALVLDIMLPANIISAFLDQKISSDLMHQSLTVLIAIFALQAVSVILGHILYPRSKFAEEDRKIFRYSTINTNASFVALPILSSIMGSLGSILTSMAMIPIRISLWTVGIAIFINEKDTAKKIKAVLLNPCMVAQYIGFIFMLLPVTWPSFIKQTFSIVGSGTTFLSMMIVGIAVSQIELKHLFRPSVMYYCALRLIVIPLLLLAVMKLLNTDETAMAVCVVIAGVPAGSFTAMMAARYHSNETLAGQVVLMSTLFSVITLPLVCLLF